MTITPNEIPAELRDVKRWGTWRKEPRFLGEQPTKVCYDVGTNRRAKSNDPTTWASVHEAIDVFRRAAGRYLGIAFFLGDGFLGIDLDDCRDPITGIIVPRAVRIIESANTYTEISPSDTGVKMIGKGTMPTEGGSGKNYRGKKPWKGKEAGGIEYYGRGRFFTFTGRHLEGTPFAINDISAPLAKLHRELYPPRPPRPAVDLSTLDVDANERVRRCAAYLDKLPASISGSGGHDRLLHAACTALRFGLNDADASALLHDYNRRADPPWGELDIDRKLAEGHKKVGAGFGSMLVDRMPHVAVRVSRRRVVVRVGGDE